MLMLQYRAKSSVRYEATGQDTGYRELQIHKRIERLVLEHGNLSKGHYFKMYIERPANGQKCKKKIYRYKNHFQLNKT